MKLHSMRYEVEIEDVQNYVRERNQLSARNYSKSMSSPVNFQLGSMGGFLTYAEMVANLDSMRSKFPHICTIKQTIGKTTENRDIWMIKISDNPNAVESSEPEILYDAMHHAREPQSMMQMIYFMWYLLEKYDQQDSLAMQIVNTRQLYFVPIVNPDGYEYNRTISPTGGGLWRKNRRVNADGTFGVDLNRNYAKDWGYDDIGSSPTTTSNTYRGTAAFSEPETQAMRNFVNGRNFVSDLSYHSYGSYLIYPYGAAENYYTQDSALFVNYAKLLTTDNFYSYGTVFETLQYFANGGSCDWMYDSNNEHPKIMSFTPEVGDQIDGFWPDITRIEQLALDNLTANLWLAERCSKTLDVWVPNLIEQSHNTVLLPVVLSNFGMDSNIRVSQRLELLNNQQSINMLPDSIVINGFTTFSVKNFQYQLNFNFSDSLQVLCRLVTTVNGISQIDSFTIRLNKSTVGVEANAFSTLQLYPNPSQDYVQWPASGNGKTSQYIEIFDMYGRKVMSKQSAEYFIEVESLSAGSYTLKISDGKSQQLGKFIKLQ
jgi:hypothetical protein